MRPCAYCGAEYDVHYIHVHRAGCPDSLWCNDHDERWKNWKEGRSDGESGKSKALQNLSYLLGYAFGIEYREWLQLPRQRETATLWKKFVEEVAKWTDAQWEAYEKQLTKLPEDCFS